MTEPVKIVGGLVSRKTSKWWYGQYKIEGKRYVKSLQVAIRGTPPGPNEEHGSLQYEKSRSEAEVELKNLLLEINRGRDAEYLAQAVHQARTGGRRVTVDDFGRFRRFMGADAAQQTGIGFPPQHQSCMDQWYYRLLQRALAGYRKVGSFGPRTRA